MSVKIPISKFTFAVLILTICMTVAGLANGRDSQKQRKIRSTTSIDLSTGKVTRNGIELRYIPDEYDMGDIAVGSTGYDQVTFWPFPSSPVTFGPATVSGSSDYFIESGTDTCSNQTIYYPGSCTFFVGMTPSRTGRQVGYARIGWASSFVGYSEINYYFNGVPASPTPSPTPIVQPQQPNLACGSILNVDNRTVGESIPVVGTDLRLFYSSALAPEYINNTLGLKPSYNQHGWTISKIHFYDTTDSILYRGDGRMIGAKHKVESSGDLTVVNPDGDEIYTFSSSGIHLSTSTFLTGATKYTITYDGSSRLIKIEDAYGNETIFNRDGSGNLTSIEAPHGQETTISLTSPSVISSVTNPNSESYSLTYVTGTKLLSTFTKPGGQVTTFAYDSNGYLTRDQGHGGNYWDLSVVSGVIFKESKLGLTTEVSISSTVNDGYVRTENLPDGNTFEHKETVDGLTVDSDNQLQISVATASDTRFGELFYSPSFRRTRATQSNSLLKTEQIWQDAVWPNNVTPNPFNYTTLTRSALINGNLQTSVFTRSSMTEVKTSSEGATRTTVFNSNERPTSIQIGSDTAITFSYDTLGRVTGTAQGSHNINTIAYNSAGFVSSVTNVRSETVGYTYDLAGRITQVTLPDSRVISYGYDSNGKVTSVVTPSSKTHASTFNSFEELSGYQPPSIGILVPKDTTYSYDDDKRLIGVSRPDGGTIVYAYDATKGVLNTITTPVGVYELTYSATDQLLESKSSPYDVRNSFTYVGNQIASDTQLRHSDDEVFGKTSFAYDGYRVVSRSVEDSSAVPSQLDYTFDRDDLPTQVGDMSLAYSYPSGRISTTTLGNISDTRTYNSYGELTAYSVTYVPNSTVLYSYSLTRDLGGRITEKTETILGNSKTYEYSYDDAGRLTEATEDSNIVASFTYDDNGNRTAGTIDGYSFSSAFDDQDRITSLDSRTFTFNNNGDLTSSQYSIGAQKSYVYDVTGNLSQFTGTSGVVHQYLNDGLNRRVAKYSNSALQWRYLYQDQYRIAAQLSNTGALEKEFVYAIGSNVADYMKFGGVNYRIISDYQGTPKLVVKASDGTVMQKIDYNILGKVTRDTNSCFQPFGFAGGIYDADAKLVRLGARDYDPETGRWTTKDPIMFNGGDTNLYGYILQDPVNLVDPKGTNPCVWAAIRGYYDDMVRINTEMGDLEAELSGAPHNQPSSNSCSATEPNQRRRAIENRLGQLRGMLDDMRGFSAVGGYLNASIERCFNGGGNPVWY